MIDEVWQRWNGLCDARMYAYLSNKYCCYDAVKVDMNMMIDAEFPALAGERGTARLFRHWVQRVDSRAAANGCELAI